MSKAYWFNKKRYVPRKRACIVPGCRDKNADWSSLGERRYVLAQRDWRKCSRHNELTFIELCLHPLCDREQEGTDSDWCEPHFTDWEPHWEGLKHFWKNFPKSAA